MKIPLHKSHRCRFDRLKEGTLQLNHLPPNPPYFQSTSLPSSGPFHEFHLIRKESEGELISFSCFNTYVLFIT